MDYSNYIKLIREHYEQRWCDNSILVRWDKGPIDQLPVGFSVLRVHPSAMREMWTYATCGMSLPTDSEPLELHMFSPIESDEIVELLTVVAHYHRTEKFLGLGDTVNFGRPWLSTSGCTYGLISLPYLDGPSLENLVMEGIHIRFLWLIPVTAEEVRYKKEHGLNALEEKLESSAFNYLDVDRKSTA